MKLECRNPKKRCPQMQTRQMIDKKSVFLNVIHFIFGPLLFL